MSAKYATLPDIDTAPDVYESADPAPSFDHQESSSDEAIALSTSNTPSKHRKKRRNEVLQVVSKEELDQSSLMDIGKAEKKFRKAERRVLYAYPSSPTTSSPPLSPGGSSSPKKKMPLSTRLANLRTEISTLEAEITDPSNPLLIMDDVNPGELMKGLLDVQRRLEGIKRGIGGRGALVEKLLNPVKGRTNSLAATATTRAEARAVEASASSTKVDATTVLSPSAPRVEAPHSPSTRAKLNLTDMDQRLKELENILGTTSTTLDDVNPLPPPLLPTVNKLSNQLAILTQPRHIDSISRRLKLLLSDLDRMGNTAANDAKDTNDASSESTNPLQLQEHILQLLTRLSPHIPQIPLILTRLRTLSALHTSASSFDETLAGLEDEQKQVRKGLEDLTTTINAIEKRMGENVIITAGNIKGLEQRVESVGERLKAFEK